MFQRPKRENRCHLSDRWQRFWVKRRLADKLTEGQQKRRVGYRNVHQVDIFSILVNHICVKLINVSGAQIGQTKSTTDTTAANIATQIGYSSAAVQNRIYAVRYYDRTLTAAEYAQNHFADLAKFFRIDMPAYAYLSDALKTELHTAVAGLTLDGDRADVVAAYEAVLAKHYAAAEELLDPYFLTLAEEAQLDIAPMLAIREREGRDAIAATLAAEFSEDYARNAHVIRSVYPAIVAFLDSIEFYGVQVRMETGDVDDEKPGVRSLFKIDEDALKTLLETAKAAGETVVLGATVEATVGENTVAIPISFYPSLGEDGKVTYSAEGANLGTIKVASPADEFFGFAYTVTYGNYKTYDAQKAYDLYNTEYGYSFFVKVGDTTYTREADYSEFGGTISAFEAYSYFKDAEEYKDDAILAEVIAKGAVDPSAAQ